MTTTYVGGMSIGAALPGAATVAASGEAGINAALPDIQARLAALAQFKPQPINLAAQLSLAKNTLAGVEAAIAFGITPPDISAQLAIVAAQIADLEAAIVSINADLQAVIDFIALLAEAGLHVYRYEGQVDDLGGELSTELSGGLPGGSPTDQCDALVLVTSTSATWDAMTQIFKTAP